MTLLPFFGWSRSRKTGSRTWIYQDDLFSRYTRTICFQTSRISADLSQILRSRKWKDFDFSIPAQRRVQRYSLFRQQILPDENLKIHRLNFSSQEKKPKKGLWEIKDMKKLKHIKKVATKLEVFEKFVKYLNFLINLEK